MAECKYYKQKRQVSYNGGQTWQDTGETRKGGYYSSGSTDCGYVSPIYRWTVVSGEYLCNGTTKCQKLVKEVSYDNGVTWASLGEEQAGAIIETNSSDCGYVDAQYRWVTVSGYLCDGIDKYNKEQKQISYDNGATWSNVYPEEIRTGTTLIEANSSDCGYYEPIYRWYTQSTYCDGIDLYGHQVKQVSYTNGASWDYIYPEQTQEVLIEESSSRCNAGEYKVKSEARNVATYYAYCSQNGMISSGDVQGNASDISRVTAVTIGTCATEINTNAFRGASITEITIPLGITELHNSTFAYCSSLTTVHFKMKTPPTIGTNTFTGCQALTTIYVPCGSGDAYRAVANLSSWASKIVEDDDCGCVPTAEGDGVTAYTASTIAQTFSIGSFTTKSCEYGIDYVAKQIVNGSETQATTEMSVIDVEYIGEDTYVVEFGVVLPSSTYALNLNIHLIYFDMDTNEDVYDYIIKTVKITRR